MAKVSFKDRKGVRQVFDSKERSTGTVSRLYGMYNEADYGRTGKTKKEKPFTSSVVPFEPPPSQDFKPYILPKEPKS